MKKKLRNTLSAIFLFVSGQAMATSYSLPASNESLIGEIQYNTASEGDTAVSLAQRYDVGHDAIEMANPNLNMDKQLAADTPIRVPAQHLLPNQARQGIVINLPEMRMYYFPKGSNQVLTYPIGIGKVGKTIPIQRTIIAYKKKNPVWIPPDDIRQFDLQQGIIVPKIMPPGPDNPLGPFAIYTGIPTYLIHSTIFPESIGTRASFGCIRMYESDIKIFFPSIQSGTPVVIINSPVKTGWQDNQLYVEAHEPLEEHSSAYDASLPGLVHLISSATKNQDTLVDWQLVSYIAETRDGIPHNIGMKIQ